MENATNRQMFRNSNSKMCMNSVKAYKLTSVGLYTCILKLNNTSLLQNNVTMLVQISYLSTSFRKSISSLNTDDE